MKKIIVTLISIALFHSVNGQNIGLRANTIFSNNREVNTALGGGLYLGIEDSFEKFSCILFGDYLSKKDAFNDCIDCPTKEISTSYRNISFGISGLWSKQIFQKSKFKIGPLVAYSMTDANRQGQIARWVETFNVNSIGTGLLFNLQFQQIFQLPLNFDVFITPTYLINVKSNTNPSEIQSEYKKNLTVLNLQLGLAYRIKWSSQKAHTLASRSKQPHRPKLAKECAFLLPGKIKKNKKNSLPSKK